MAVPQRPVVSTVALEREGLSSTEEVLDGRFERQVGTDTIIRPIRYAGICGKAVGARKTIAAEEFLAVPFFIRLDRETGLVKFALEDVIIVALRVQADV